MTYASESYPTRKQGSSSLGYLLVLEVPRPVSPVSIPTGVHDTRVFPPSIALRPLLTRVSDTQFILSKSLPVYQFLQLLQLGELGSSPFRPVFRFTHQDSGKL